MQDLFLEYEVWDAEYLLGEKFIRFYINYLYSKNDFNLNKLYRLYCISEIENKLV